jgi:glucoamylase
MTGERAHYEIANKNFGRAAELLNHLTAFSNEGGMIPEQVWDVAHIPERGLFTGVASGSAMPLVWAHGEYVKLCRSIQDEAIFDMPAATNKRYLIDKTPSTHAFWRFNDKVKTIVKGKILRIEAEKPFSLHWSAHNWHVVKDTESTPSVFGTYFVDIPTADVNVSNKVVFTFFWRETSAWEGQDFEVAL